MSKLAPEQLVDSGVTTSFALRTAMGCEWRLVRSDLGWLATLAALIFCIVYALLSGSKLTDERARGIEADRADEAQRLSTLTKTLAQIESGAIQPPAEPFRDPRNPIYVGRGQGAATAFLPNAPLAVVASGLSDLYPPAFKVSASSKDSFLFVDEIANPTRLLSGGFDLAFVIVYLYPLLLLALSYNILSGEREQGTLALTAASSASLATVLAGKLIVRTGLVVAVALGSVWLGLIISGAFASGGSAGWIGLGLLTLAVVVYGAFWITLALWVNSFRRDSAFNAVALTMTWAVLVLAAPAAMNASAQWLYPSPARAEMLQAVREAAIDVERDRAASEALYLAEHPSTLR